MFGVELNVFQKEECECEAWGVASATGRNRRWANLGRGEQKCAEKREERQWQWCSKRSG